MCYHPEAFGILFLLAFAYHALQDQTWRAWLALLLALTVKEDMWVYGVVVALLVARRGRWKRTLAFAVVAVGYYVVVVQMIGGWLYPTANYFNASYEVEGRPQSKLQIAQSLLGRWREFLPLLFTGPGLFVSSVVPVSWRLQRVALRAGVRGDADVAHLSGLAAAQ